MGSYGQVALQEIWAMLDKCAPGHTRKLGTHYYRIQYNGRVYPSFPKGEHGHSNPLIQKGHIKRMARFLQIYECAIESLNL